MAYATSDEVISEFKRLVTTGGNALITTAEIDRFIDEETNQVNARIANRYVVDIVLVDSPISFDVVKKITIDFVAYRIAMIINNKKNVPVPDKMLVQELNEGSSFKISKDRLDRIQMGLDILPDAVGANPSTQGMLSFSSDPANKVIPVFDKDLQQW